MVTSELSEGAEKENAELPFQTLLVVKIFSQDAEGSGPRLSNNHTFLVFCCFFLPLTQREITYHTKYDCCESYLICQCAFIKK